MQLYASKTAKDHEFLLGIHMQLVPEINTILKTKGWKNVEKLWACQNAWNTLKYTTIKILEFEMLDYFHTGINLLLCQATLLMPCPTNKKFTLFHSINKSHFKTCHSLTVLRPMLTLPILPFSYFGDRNVLSHPIVYQFDTSNAKSRTSLNQSN